MADEDPILNQTVPNRRLAERVARSLGCSGAHKMGDGWMPCRSHEHLITLIRRGSAGYREWLAERGEEEKSVIPMKRPTMRMRYVGRIYTSEEDAKNAANEIGCNGIRKIVIDGKVFYRPCRRMRRPRKEWEKLRERGVTGIATGAEGGLYSAPIG